MIGKQIDRGLNGVSYIKNVVGSLNWPLFSVPDDMAQSQPLISFWTLFS